MVIHLKDNTKTKRINITILEEQYNEIHRIVENQNKYLGFSEFIREAIRIQLDKIEQQETLKNIHKSLIPIQEVQKDIKDVRDEFKSFIEVKAIK